LIAAVVGNARLARRDPVKQRVAATLCASLRCDRPTGDAK